MGLRFLLVTAMLAALASCADELDPIPNPLSQSPDCGDPDVTICVDGANGSDNGAGTAAEPFRTVTRALQIASAGDVVQVLPGLYDDIGHGEAFPLVVPPGVLLRGDPPNRGTGSTFTELVGDAGPDPISSFEPVVFLRDGAELSGFRIQNPAANTFDLAVRMAESNAALVSNTIANSKNGVRADNGSSNLYIADNDMVSNNLTVGSVGLIFVTGGGTNSIVENNLFSSNQIGVEYDSVGGDLGGGPAGSVGGNLLTCNARNDLWTNTGGITIDAANNAWDHNPPTFEVTQTSMGVDIFSGSTAVINTPGAQIVSSPCP